MTRDDLDAALAECRNLKLTEDQVGLVMVVMERLFAGKRLIRREYLEWDDRLQVWRVTNE